MRKAEVRMQKSEHPSGATLGSISICLRKAVVSDVPRLREVIEASVRGLQAGDYSPRQIEAALKTVYGVDSRLIADGTYLVVEDVSKTSPVTVGCGGGGEGRALYGGEQFAGRGGL